MSTRTCAAIAAIALVVGCGDNLPGECQPLFGVPSANTGLSAADCQPQCSCGDGFVPPTYTDAQIAAVERRTMAGNQALLDRSPYEEPELWPGDPDALCAVIPTDDNRYLLRTFATRGAVTAAGGTVTHHGACGQCSTLQDLAVYMRMPDLAGPVRECGIEAINGGEAEATACLRQLGFTPACAQIWAFNTINTREQCLLVCLGALDEPYHKPDGTLSDCIQCDEDESGPVFKAVAGRTRRNSGLASALCRPCESIAPVLHFYP